MLDATCCELVLNAFIVIRANSMKNRIRPLFFASELLGIVTLSPFRYRCEARRSAEHFLQVNSNEVNSELLSRVGLEKRQFPWVALERYRPMST